MRLLALALLALAAAAQPNLNGTWVMNYYLSDGGSASLPTTLTQKITQDGTGVRISTGVSAGNRNFSYSSTYSTVAGPTANRISQSPVLSTAQWDGDTLITKSQGELKGYPFTVEDRWQLSADSKTLTLHRHWSGDLGQTDQRYVFHRR